jgi:DNA-binding NarL/FixJ family response regulator
VIVLLLVNRLDSASAEAAIAEGGQAILFGDVTGAQLATAAAAAASGLLIFSSDLANLVRQALVGHTREALDDRRAEASSLVEPFPEKLTQRELEVLEMMSEGLSNKEIAALLNISVHTAKFHISSILGKLGASSRTEATAIGLRHGLITI